MRKLGIIALASLVIVAATASPVDSIAVVARMVLAYAWLILLPGLAWVCPLREHRMESLVLANLGGFAFGFVYFLLDIVGVPLRAWTFAVVPGVITVAGVLFWKWRGKRAPVASAS